MKRRITYIVPNDKPSDSVRHVRAVDKNTVAVDALPASKHVRLRLPQAVDPELGVVTLQWARSRLLHLPFDPPAEENTHIDAALDSSIGAVQAWASQFGFSIGQPVAADTWLSWHSAAGPTLFPPDLADLEGAEAIRVSTNPSKGEVIAEAWFPSAQWTETIDAPAEVGVLSPQSQDGHIALQGRVRKVGSDNISEPLLLHWYPRHRAAAGRANASFLEPYGLHPTLELAVDSERPLPVCRLFAKLDLPPEVFINRYQLDDLPRYDPPSELLDVWGETDLELPVWAVEKGSVSLFELSEPGTHRIPLHFRYARPERSLEFSGVLPEPHVYWACRDDRMPPRRMLEDREHVGIASVHPLEDTAFYVLSSNTVDFTIPAIGPGHTRTAELTTLAVVVLGFVAVLSAVVQKIRQPKLKAE